MTELMVNPKSADDAVWEWIEVRNEGAAPIDLNGALFAKLGEAESTTADISAATAANTVSPAGGVAVLYDGDGTAFNDQLFRQAWSLGAGVPLIAVDSFPSLANSGTGRNFGLWTDAAAYAATLADDERRNAAGEQLRQRPSVWTTPPAFPRSAPTAPGIRLERRRLLRRWRQLDGH